LAVDKQVVLKVLQAFPNGETMTGLQKPTRLNWPRLKPALDMLVEEGLVEECTVTRGNKQQYGGYRVKGNGHPYTPLHNSPTSGV